MKTKEQLLTEIIEQSFNLTLNMNDVFAWSCADCEDISGDDMVDLIPYIEKYGWEAQVALVSIKREIYNGNVMHPQKRLKTEHYAKVRKEIYDELCDKDKDTFLDIRYRKKEVDEELALFNERVRYSSAKAKPYQLQVHYLEKAEIYGIGSNFNEAREDLKNKFNTNKDI